LEIRPELVNEDPYGQGWLFRLTPADPLAAETELLDAQAYFQLMLTRVEEEAKKLGH
jgi:glycine cleavage system H protein